MKRLEVSHFFLIMFWIDWVLQNKIFSYHFFFTNLYIWVLYIRCQKNMVWQMFYMQINDSAIIIAFVFCLVTRIWTNYLLIKHLRKVLVSVTF